MPVKVLKTPSVVVLPKDISQTQGEMQKDSQGENNTSNTFIAS